jgi:uncharacterized membrane protein HdeD (DUF308 family)
MLFGVAILFWNRKSTAGWVLTVAGALFILAGVIANMHIYFQPTTLFNTMVMLMLLVGGLGLIAAHLQPMRRKQTIDLFDRYPKRTRADSTTDSFL